MHTHFTSSKFFTIGLFRSSLALKKSFQLLSHCPFGFSSITQFLPIRLSLWIWLLGVLALHIFLHTGSPNKANCNRKISRTTDWKWSIVFAIARAHFSLDGKVQMIEKYSWLFTTFTALALLSWKCIQIMNYCRQCKNKKWTFKLHDSTDPVKCHIKPSLKHRTLPTGSKGVWVDIQVLYNDILF